MRIVFTGASSFTGSWFVRALAADGHQVVATFRSPLAAYEGTRARRVARAAATAETAEGVAFGDDAFLGILRRGGLDLLCHHGAEVAGYRSPAFDVESAVRANTHRCGEVLAALAEQGAGLLLTGTVFERGEGDGDPPLHAFSPYGLAKTLTAEILADRCHEAGVPFAKFVIANPFGPWEEPRFTTYLARAWLAGETATVQTPDYVSSQGEFAERCARELGPRLGVDCPLRLAEQTDFPEPRVRVNTDPLDPAELRWDETRAWDELAGYYRDPSA